MLRIRTSNPVGSYLLR